MKKRWIFFLSGLALLVIVVASLTTLIWTGWLGERLRLYATEQLEDLTGWEFEIGRIGGNLVTRAVIHGLRVTTPRDSTVLIEAGEIAVEYDIFDLILGSKDVRYATITDPKINMAGDWSLKETEGPSEGDSEILDFSLKGLEIRSGEVTGLPTVERVDSIDLLLSLRATDNRVEYTLIRCSFGVGDLDVTTAISQGHFEGNLLRLNRFQLATPLSRVSAEGIVGAGTVYLDGEADIGLSEVSSLFGLLPLDGAVESSFRVRRGEDSSSLEGSVELRDGVYDTYELRDLSGRFASDLETMTVEVEEWSVGGGEAGGIVEIDLRDYRVEASMAGTDLDLALVSSELRELSSCIGFEADLDLAITGPEVEGVLEVRLGESTIRGFGIDGLASRLSFDSEVLEIDELRLSSGNAEGVCTGRIFGTAVDLAVDVERIDLVELREILEMDTLSGELFADLLIQGDIRKPFVIGNFWSRGLTLPYAELGYLSGNVSFQYSAENPRVDAAVLMKEGEVSGQAVSGFRAEVSGEGGLFSYTTSFDVEARDVQLEGAVVIGDGEVRVVNRRMTITSNEREVTTDGDLVLELAPEIKLAKTRFVIGDGWLDVSGSYAPPDSITADVSGEAVDLADVAEMIGLKEVLRGSLDLELHVRGTHVEPEFDLAATIRDFTYEYAKLNRLKTQLQYGDGVLTVSEVGWEGRRSSYRAYGSIPLQLSSEGVVFTDEEMDLFVELDGLDPWVLQPAHQYVELKACNMEGNVHVHGTVLDPRMSGEVSLSDGQFYSRFLKTFITGAESRVVLDGSEIEVESFTATAEGGPLRAKGVIHTDRLVPESIDLHVDVARLPVRGIEDVYAVIGADVRVSGELIEPSIDGNVHVNELLITTPFQQRAGPRSEEKPLEFQCNLTVDANRSIWVRNRNANIQLDGDLNVTVKDGKLFLSGELNTVRGWVSYYDREFDIVRGRFRFTDIPEINPELDILAEMEVAFVTTEDGARSSKRDVITLTITGPMRQPEIVLGSESGELSELDIFSLITLNMTWDELGSEERGDILREQAAGRVLDLAASQFTHQIRQAVGLDALRIRVNPIGEEAGAKLTVGKYVSRDLYVSYTSELFSTAKDQFRVEYFVARRGSVVGERDDEGRYFIGLNYKLRF